MPEFKCLSESELDQLSDEELVAYIAAAREAGCPPECLRTAMGILAFRHEVRVSARVARKVPVDDIEDVVMNVIESVVRSAFEGKVIGEFINFLNVITDRRIADFHRRRENVPDQAPLASEHGTDDTIWGLEPSVDDSSAALEMADAVERVLASRNPLHRRIIELYGPDGIGEDLSSAGAVERLAAEGEEVSEANVQQVWHRFKKDLEEELRKGEDGGSDG